MRKVIKKQAGGYALPNYIGSSVQPMLPNISGSIGQLIDPYDRYAKEQQVGLQNSQAWQGLINSQISNYSNLQNIQINKDQAETNRKFTELRAKELDNKILKENQDSFSQMLALDDNIFLEGDDEKYQAILRQAKMDDESLANSVDYRDSDALYNAMSKRKALLSTFRNAYKNKQVYIDLNKELASIESGLNLDKTIAGGYLDINARNQFTDDLTYAREKLNGLRYNGSQFDLNDPVIQRLRSTTESQFVNKDLYTRNTNADIETQEATAVYKAAQADKMTADAGLIREKTLHPEKFRNSNLYEMMIAAGYGDIYAKNLTDKIESEANKNDSITDKNNNPTTITTTIAPSAWLGNGTTKVDANGQVTAATYTANLPTGTTSVDTAALKALGYKPDSLGRITKLKNNDLVKIFGDGANFENLSTQLEGKGLKITKTTDNWVESDVYMIEPDYSRKDNTEALEAWYKAQGSPNKSTTKVTGGSANQTGTNEKPTNFFVVPPK